MQKWTHALASLLVFGLVAANPAAAQDLPEGVTKQMIEDGGKLFRGNGMCYACHGQQGSGIPNVGADLADDEWLHSDGSLDGILTTIKNGVPSDKSSFGVSMPPKGGSALDEDNLRAVAAYVWSLRQSEK